MNFYLKALLLIASLATIGFVIHTFLEEQPAFDLIKLYSFLGIATLASVCGMYYLYQLVPNQLGYVFLGIVLMKFGAAILIFPQLFQEKPALTKVQMLSFLIPYFAFLAVEAFMVIKWLNNTPLAAPEE